MRFVLWLVSSIVLTLLFLTVAGFAVFRSPDPPSFRPSEDFGLPYRETRSVYNCKPPETCEPLAHYSLNFVEFDDDGHYAHPVQKASLIKSLKDLYGPGSEGSRPKDVLTILYVHGLNHNASEKDTNIDDLHTLLEAAAKMQARFRGKDVSVFGVYVGWPGRAYGDYRVNSGLAYAGREAASDRVSEQGDLLDLLRSIGDVRRQGGKHSRFVVIGHSLGGRAAYRALRPVMQAGANGNSGKFIADLALFVNPAVPAWEHQSLHNLLVDSPTDEVSIPRYIIATSEADGVLRRIFPIVQGIGSFIRGDFYLEEEKRWQALGVHEPFQTHELTLEASTEGAPALLEEELALPGDRVSQRDELYRFDQVRYQREGETLYSLALSRLARADESERVKGTKVMIINVDAQIVPDHNEIFTLPFVDFVSRVLNCTYWKEECRKGMLEVEKSR